MNIFRRFYERFCDEWNRGFNYILGDCGEKELAKLARKGMEEDGIFATSDEIRGLQRAYEKKRMSN